jgi:uncharacterized 2Fe-2S/4Fe-4S cluster protein (DUF4445 family)
VSADVPVTFSPGDLTVWVSPGVTVVEAAREAGVLLAAPCGGRGVCGACGVRVLDGALEPPDEEELLGLMRAREGVRLACRARVQGPVTVRPLVLGRELSPPRGGAAAQLVPLVAGVDLGTTSVAAALVDPRTGRELARASVCNQQQAYGADVLSRISAAQDGAAYELQRLAVGSVEAALDAAATSAGVLTQGIERVAVAGNSAMTALLAGTDTTPLATYPFEAPYQGGLLSPGPALAGKLAPNATIEVLPPVAGFVGGDALAGALSAGLVGSVLPVLLVDFGTNAEIVLAREGSLVVASAAAGPAFEGVGISCGGSAADGAVTAVRIGDDGSVVLEVMGSSPAQWMSGSGLVSAIAALRRSGHLTSSGLLTEGGPLEARFSRNSDGVLQVRLGDDGSEELVLTQLDVRTLQLAKAAVRVGIETVLRVAAVPAESLEHVYVAGAFGLALDPDDLVELGVLPKDVAEKTVRAGNASLDGAAAIALDPELEGLVRTLAQNARHVELAQKVWFASALMTATEFAPYQIL